MLIKDKAEPMSLRKNLKKYIGECTLEFLENGEVVDSITFHNDPTGWINTAVNEGNFFNLMPTNKIIPYLKWLLGVVLLDKNGDPTHFTIPGDANIIACANNVSGSDSTDLRRGSYNPEASSVIEDESGRIIGFESVWNWSDTRGNCGADQKIKAVCLTRPALAIARYGDSMPPDTVMNEILSTVTVALTLADCQIIDFGGETSYRVDISSGKIVVKKYQVDTWRYHIQGVYDSNGAYDVTKLLGQAELTPSIAISNDVTKASVSFIGNKLHVVAWNGQTLVDHAIDASADDPDNWTITSTSHSFNLGSGVSIKASDGGFLTKDVVLYSYDEDNDYYFVTLVGTNNKFYKCSLSNDADITELPGASLANSNGPMVQFGNGDWIKWSWGQDNVTFMSCNYCHAGTVYLARDTYNAPAGWGAKFIAVNNTGRGTLLISQTRNGRYGNDHYMTLALPIAHVATVWNISDDTKIKTNSKTMRVKYRITESNE